MGNQEFVKRRNYCINGLKNMPNWQKLPSTFPIKWISCILISLEELLYNLGREKVTDIPILLDPKSAIFSLTFSTSTKIKAAKCNIVRQIVDEHTSLKYIRTHSMHIYNTILWFLSSSINNNRIQLLRKIIFSMQMFDIKIRMILHFQNYIKA